MTNLDIFDNITLLGKILSGDYMAQDLDDDDTTLLTMPGDIVTREQKKEAVLYKKQAFLPLKKKLNNIKKLSSFSAHAVAEEIKQIDSDEITKNIMSGANSTVSKQRSTKKRWLSAIFLLVNVIVLVVILWVQLSGEESVSFAELITQTINWWWILLAVGFFFLINALDGMRTWILIKFSTGRSRPWLSYKSITIQRFYDCVTPLATGGQPFQVFYLHKRGLSASSATSVPLAKYLYAQITYMFFIIVVFILKQVYILTLSPAILTLCYIGLALNLLLIGAIVFLSVSKKAAPSFTIGILKLCNKMHLVKDYRRKYVQVMRIVREYVATFRKFMSNGWIIVSEVFISILYMLLIYSLPFLIYCAFGNPFDLNMWANIMVMTVVCDLAVSFVPWPGAAGVAELSFNALFASLFTSCAAWAVLFWRILTYYGYLIQGMLVMFYDFAFGNKKIQPLLDRFKEEDAYYENLRANGNVGTLPQQSKSKKKKKGE